MTHMMKIAPFALMALTTAVIAQDADIDINADGMYSLAELQAVYPDMLEATFAQMDTSGDGKLDSNEISAAIAAGQMPG